MPNSLVVEIDLQDDTKITVINTYHAVPMRGGHDLHYLFRYKIDKLTPTVLIGDFNTHTHRWSLLGRAPSSWGAELEEWLNQNGLQVMNPDGVPTWVGLREGDRPSIIDLAFANEVVIFTNQISPLEVSLGDSLGSDHTALLFQIYPLTHIALQPPPAPIGYRADPEHCDS